MQSPRPAAPATRPGTHAARPAAPARSEMLEALARGLSVLTAFDPTRRQMTLAELARQVDLPRASARRALHTLAELGYVETDGRMFRLTPRVLRLASAYLGSNPVSTLLQPCCERVSAAAKDACSAAVLDGAEAVFVAHGTPARMVSQLAMVGYRLPAYCSSLGRVLLAGLPDPALDAFLAALRPEAVTPYTVTDKARLRDEILAVRARGFSLVDEEAELGFRSVAVPVKRHDGATIAALNLGAQVARCAPETLLTTHLPLLRAAAEELGPQLL